MAEGVRLESVLARKGYQGSTPCLSASTINGFKRKAKTRKVQKTAKV